MAAAAANGDPVALAMAIPLIAAQQQREALAAAQAAAAAAAAQAAASHQDSGSRGWGAGGRGSKGGRGGRGGRGRGSGWEVADTAGSREGGFSSSGAAVSLPAQRAANTCLPRNLAGTYPSVPCGPAAGSTSKRQRVLLPLRPYPQPWEVQEVRFAVLCCAVLRCAVLPYTCRAGHARVLASCAKSCTKSCYGPPLQDFALCSVVAQLLSQGQPLGYPLFLAAADALAAGG